jgi:hypothetical protein
MGEGLEKFKFRFQSSGMSPKTKDKKSSDRQFGEDWAACS